MAWFNTSWGFRKPIDTDNTLIPSAQTDFPLLVSITDADISAAAQADGDDIVFTDTDGTTQLAHEIEKYVSGTGELIAWVKVPSLPSATDKTIYVYYGHAGAANQEDVTNTWDSNYLMVQHMSEDPSGAAPQMLDSTSGNIDGTTAGSMVSGDLVASQVGDGLDFDGSTQYVTFPTVSLTTLTVSAWINQNNTNNAVYFLKRVVNAEWLIMCEISTLKLRGNGTANTVEAAHPGANAWFYMVGTITGTSGEIFVDGASAATGAVGAIPNGSGILQLGRFTTGYYFNGTMDEVRVSDVVRSDDWIAVEYNNQNAPGSFLTVGVEEEAPPVTGEVNLLLLLGVGG